MDFTYWLTVFGHWVLCACSWPMNEHRLRDSVHPRWGALCACNILTMRDPEPHVNGCFISLLVRLAAAAVAINVR
jgi:hypothetical protein